MNSFNTARSQANALRMQGKASTRMDKQRCNIRKVNLHNIIDNDFVKEITQNITEVELFRVRCNHDN